MAAAAPPRSKATHPRTDCSGRYELLLRSTCPFCRQTVYFARAGVSEELSILHEGSVPCRSFHVALAADREALVFAVLRLAGRQELAAFCARAEPN